MPYAKLCDLIKLIDLKHKCSVLHSIFINSLYYLVTDYKVSHILDTYIGYLLGIVCIHIHFCKLRSYFMIIVLLFSINPYVNTNLK